MITSTLNTSLFVLVFDQSESILNQIQLALNELSAFVTDFFQKQSNGHL
jgi:hypothetical protein